MRDGVPNFSKEEKTMVAQFLLEPSENGRPLMGKINEAAANWGVSRKTISKVWAATKKQLSEGRAVIFHDTLREPHKDRLELNIERFKNIPFRKRSTYRSIAKEMGVSKSLVGIWVKRGLLRAHTNVIKPELTPQNKLLRLNFSLSALQYDRALNTIKFKSMHYIVHIDEKWFYITRENERYYLLPGEPEPHRSCKSKRFITKLMFMCAVARPQYASNGECIFYGKIGIFPFTKKEAAKRNNKNRVKGTLETKQIESITKEDTKDCLINKIIVAIKRKWPSHASKEIFIQQDNVKPHIKDNDPDFRAAASSDGFNIHLVCQPANSLNTNINDLGWFRAIQSLQVETSSYSVDDLVKNVCLSYENLTNITLNNVFLSLQGCMVEIMKCKGHNTFKLPRMKKASLIRQGNLPECLQVDEGLVKECIDYLRQDENAIVSPYDVETLTSDLGY